LEILKDHLKEGNKALDVGSGSGYLTACMAMMVFIKYITELKPFLIVHFVFVQVGETGKVVGIDHIDGLVDMSIKNIKSDKPELLSSGRVKLVGTFVFFIIWRNPLTMLTILVGDGRKGYKEEAPYNAIHVGAAAPKLPEEVSYIKFDGLCCYL
jgi:protein-L-isoaspartate(D-aspartate) O-methyltransferase